MKIWIEVELLVKPSYSRPGVYFFEVVSEPRMKPGWRVFESEHVYRTRQRAEEAGLAWIRRRFVTGKPQKKR